MNGVLQLVHYGKLHTNLESQSRNFLEKASPNLKFDGVSVNLYWSLHGKPLAKDEVAVGVSAIIGI